MRYFTMISIIAILAPAVLSQSDDPLFYYFFWLQPSARSNDSSNPLYSTDISESKNDSDQYEISAPVQYEFESKIDTTAKSDEEIMSPESGERSTSTTNSEERKHQALVDSKFWEHFMTILSKVEEEQLNKNELNKLTGKKYNSNDEENSSEIFNAGSSSRQNDAPRMGWDSNSDQSSSEENDEKSEENSNKSTESFVRSSNVENNKSESPNTNFKTAEISSTRKNGDSGISERNSNEYDEFESSNSNFESTSKTYGKYFNPQWSSDFEEPYIVPLEPFFDDYKPTPYSVEESDEETPDEKIEINNTLPRTSVSTTEENIPSITSSEMVSESEKEGKLFTDKIEDTDNQRIAEIQSSTMSNVEEENIEVISSNDEKVETENNESINEDKADSTVNIVENEIPTKPNDDKILGHFSFGQFLKSLIKRMAQ